MLVTLLSHTPDFERLIYTAARTCYSSSHPSRIWEDTDDEEQRRRLIRKVLESGHHSVLEHATFTFEISGISRAASHQLVRHRLASFSQQSQRYVAEKEELNYIIPPSISENAELKNNYVSLVESLFSHYKSLLRAGIKAEDARFLLPACVCTNLVMSMNARELLHFLRLRCCRRAQWEIREVAWRMLGILLESAPVIFEGSGPPCIADGFCPEGANSCGKPFSIEEKNEILESF